MCGITGIFKPTLPEDSKVFPDMIEALKHRGPDESGSFCNEEVLLGSRRLAILDVEGGRQPIGSESGEIQIVLNGEIYNHADLREELKQKGHLFKTSTDTEILAHLYEEKGRDLVHDLRGMFAFALYDKKKSLLLLARDRVGKKPLFYTIAGKKLLFASEIKALLKHPDVRKEPDFEALYHYFTLKHIPRPLTAFRGITSLLPAEIITFGPDLHPQKSIYWSPSFTPTPLSEEETIEILDEKLKEAVKLRVYSSDVPVGAFLSGGLDSSLIVCLMREFARGELHTFSLAYAEEENPDIPYAKKMAALLETNHHELILETKSIAEELPQILEAFDEPFGGVFSPYFLSRMIAKHVKVALSGDGADELFGSYANHRMAWPITRFLKGDQSWKEWVSPEDEKKIEILADPNPAIWRMRLYPFDDEEKRNLFSPEFRRRLNGASSLALLQKRFSNTTALDPLNRVLEVDFHYLLPDEVLTYVDRLSMAHGVEVRSPYLDQEVVSFSASIPGEYKINHGRTKEILKKLASKYLPTEIIERPKKGFILPLHRWLLGSMKDYTLQKLSAENLGKSNLIQEDVVRQLVLEHENGVKDHAYGIFSLLMFQLWWEKHFA